MKETALQVPDHVLEILERLTDNGYEAYVVGGCVRDSILRRTPNDWDITTSALPGEVKKLFRRTIDTGIAHGTVTVMIRKEGCEVTTYRLDGEYEDSRHPKEVTFTDSLREDLRRRDFTINAMAYNPGSGLVDLFGGIRDLEEHVVRCVGDPDERFTEDALRILRAVRFSAQLGFSIEEKTREAIRRHAPNLRNISAERIREELVKILVSPHPDYLRTAWEEGITELILPEFDRCMETEQNTPYHCYTVGEHILKTLTCIRNDPCLRLTMLLHDMAKPAVKTTDENGCDHFYDHVPAGERMAEEVLKRLKFDNATISKVKRLIRYHDERPLPDMKSVRKSVNLIGEDLFPLYLEVQMADLEGQSDYLREEKLERILKVTECYHRIVEEKQCVSLKTLAVTGDDLISMGMKPGKEMGEVLKRLLEHVLEYPEDNRKDRLLPLVPEILEAAVNSNRK